MFGYFGRHNLTQEMKVSIGLYVQFSLYCIPTYQSEINVHFIGIRTFWEFDILYLSFLSLSIIFINQLEN